MEGVFSVSAIVLEYADRRIVVQAACVGRFDDELPAAGDAVDLDQLLAPAREAQGATGARHRAPRGFRVTAGDGVLHFQTRAQLRAAALRSDDFYSLPRVARASGCRDWVRGLVLLDTAERARDLGAARSLAVWIDLARLATALGGGSQT